MIDEVEYFIVLNNSGCGLIFLKRCSKTLLRNWLKNDDVINSFKKR